MLEADPGPLGTTVVAVFLEGDTIFAAWCGDSRIYHFRDNNIKWMSDSCSTIREIKKELYATPTLVDIDNDGDMDMFIGNTYGKIVYFEFDNATKKFISKVGTNNSLYQIDVGENAKPGFGK